MESNGGCEKLQGNFKYQSYELAQVRNNFGDSKVFIQHKVMAI